MKTYLALVHEQKKSTPVWILWVLLICKSIYEDICGIRSWAKETSQMWHMHVTTSTPKRSTWRLMFNQFMRIRNHSNVTFVATAAAKRVTWKNILNQYMRKRKHSNVRNVTTATHKWVHSLKVHVVSYWIYATSFCCPRRPFANMFLNMFITHVVL